MAESTLVTPSFALATVLVDELVRTGVREVVLCPGSRSAPLAYAVLAAERAGRLRLHVRVDERSAGFLALGLARGSGAPVAVVTTSGTAVANLHPAVLEAHHAGVPLVVVSADRPHELRGTGANQTTRQPGIFGSATRYAADLPAPVARPGLAPFWRSTVCRAVAAATGATGEVPGPVHLDVGLREPLAPEPDAPAWPESLDGREGGEPWVAVTGFGHGVDVDVGVGIRVGVAAADTLPGPGLDDVERTLVLVGDTRRPRDGRVGRRLGRPTRTPGGRRALRRGGGPGRRAAARAAAPHRGRLARRQRPRAGRRRRATRPSPVPWERSSAGPTSGSTLVSEGGQWPDPSHVAAAVHPPTVIRPGAPSTQARRRPHEPASGAGRGTRPVAIIAEAVAAQPFPWPSGLAVAVRRGDSPAHDALLVVGS